MSSKNHRVLRRKFSKFMTGAQYDKLSYEIASIDEIIKIKNDPIQLKMLVDSFESDQEDDYEFIINTWFDNDFNKFLEKQESWHNRGFEFYRRLK